MRRLKAALSATAFLLIACDDGSSDPERRGTGDRAEETPRLITSSPCSTEEDVASDISQRMPPTLVEDIDGDGAKERISVHIDPEGSPECVAFIVVEREDATHSAAVERVEDSNPLFFGRLVGAAHVDERPGKDLVVQVMSGASTQFVALYTWDDGIVPYEVEEGENIFAFGGSVGHVDAVDCVKQGLVVATSAVKHGKRFTVRRLFYDVTGLTILPLPERTEKLEMAPNELTTLPEFRSGPFAGCPV